MKFDGRTATAVAAILMAATAASAGVNVALVPSAAQVAPGDDFEVVLRVTESGSRFNSYEAVVGFEPTDVTFLQEPLSLQEGSYMRDACGNTFNSFQAEPSQLVIQHSLLCPGTSLTGPGDLYVLHFRANSAPVTTAIGFVSVGFYDSGAEVPVSSSADAVVQIGSPVDASSDFASDSAPRLLVGPNPFAVRTQLRIESPAAGMQTVRIYDSRGSLVRELDAARFAPRQRVLSWDGQDVGGEPCPAGVYWITVRMESRQVSRRVTLLR